VGPPDAIAIGSPMVWIGGLLAARKGDASEHGGAIMAGAASVQIGGAPPGVTMVRRGKIWVVVDRVHKTITLIGVQQYSCAGASADYIDKATKCINSTWSGPTTFEGETYQVNSMIQGTGGKDNPSEAQVCVVHTTDPPAVTSQKDPSNQPLNANGVGHQHDTDTDGGTLTPAHEFGHSMGLPDEYTEGPKNPDGTRNVTRTGPPGGIMGYTDPGSRPTPGNFNSIVNGTGLSP
jgi:hypothetical protein